GRARGESLRGVEGAGEEPRAPARARCCATGIRPATRRRSARCDAGETDSDERSRALRRAAAGLAAGAPGAGGSRRERRPVLAVRALRLRVRIDASGRALVSRPLAVPAHRPRAPPAAYPPH